MIDRLRHLALALGAAAGLGAALAAAPAARAQAVDDLVALTGENTLLFVQARRVVTRQVNISLGGRVAGIDVRPANGQLYALFQDGRVAAINPATGAAVGNVVTLTGFPAGLQDDPQLAVDFNPVADRLRIIAQDGTNLRANVDAGTFLTDTPLNFAGGAGLGSPPDSGTPAVVAAAYSNSFAGTGTTALFDIEGSPQALYLQFPPNAGTLAGIVAVPQSFGGSFGFDIGVTAENRNRGFVVGNGTIFELDLAGGRVVGSNPIARLTAPVRDIAFLGRVRNVP